MYNHINWSSGSGVSSLIQTKMTEKCALDQPFRTQDSNESPPVIKGESNWMDDSWSPKFVNQNSVKEPSLNLDGMISTHLALNQSLENIPWFELIFFHFSDQGYFSRTPSPVSPGTNKKTENNPSSSVMKGNNRLVSLLIGFLIE